MNSTGIFSQVPCRVVTCSSTCMCKLLPVFPHIVLGVANIFTQAQSPYPLCLMCGVAVFLAVCVPTSISLLQGKTFFMCALFVCNCKPASRYASECSDDVIPYLPGSGGRPEEESGWNEVTRGVPEAWTTLHAQQVSL